MLGNKAMKHSAEDLTPGSLQQGAQSGCPFADEGLSLVLSSKAEHLKRLLE